MKYEPEWLARSDERNRAREWSYVRAFIWSWALIALVLAVLLWIGVRMVRAAT